VSGEFRYRAFISYSHADEAWAKWLHQRLENYRVPARLVGRSGAHGIVPRRIGRCFRDQVELSAASHLSDILQQALRDSQSLIVVCSPSSAHSQWVNEEIKFFRALGKGGQVYALIVGGEPGAQDPARECFPAALLRDTAGQALVEPLAADARAGRDGKVDGFLKLAAGLIGVGFDELRRREQRRRARLMAGAVAASIGIAATTSLLAVAAYRERNEAQLQQHRAEHVTDFLLSVFKASDPRIPSDKPRGQITAKELLDVSADRIQAQFASDPDTEITLLGVSADVYRELNELDRYAKLREQQVALARARFGDADPLVIGGLVDEAEVAAEQTRAADALKLLDATDPLLQRAGLDQSVLRARWQLARSMALRADFKTLDAARQAAEQAVQLMARLAPQDPGYAEALKELGIVYSADGDDAKAIEYTRQAIAEVEKRTPDAGELVDLYGNLATFHFNRGDTQAADDAYSHAEIVSRNTYGAKSPLYWSLTSFHGSLLCGQGLTPRALALFENTMAVVPADSEDVNATRFREFYANCLYNIGRAAESVPLLAAALQRYEKGSLDEFEANRARLELGAAEAAAGRIEDARRDLGTALTERIGKDAPGSSALIRRRERYGRFLLDQGETAAAEAQFKEILAQAGQRNTEDIALTYGDLARLALGRHDSAAALDASKQAVERFARIEHPKNMRAGPSVWLARAAALTAAGDRQGALEWARKALEMSERYDEASATSVRDAQAAVRAASSST
jgi:serine/threonine-protein kinase